MPTNQPSQKQQNAALRSRIRRIFSENPEVKADAVEALRDAWGCDLPSFQMEELAIMPAENCTLAAARRDGIKELVDWLAKI